VVIRLEIRQIRQILVMMLLMGMGRPMGRHIVAERRMGTWDAARLRRRRGRERKKAFRFV